jgi:hypothetical protein
MEKEKAIELINTFKPFVDQKAGYEQGFSSREQAQLFHAKKCALKCVEQIFIALTDIPYGIEYMNRLNFWLGVKQEITKYEL